MKFYQEITIIDGDKKIFELWSDLFMQIHLALVEHAKSLYGEETEHGDIGISFPDYRSFKQKDKHINYLGSKIRLFATTEQQLNELSITEVIKRFDTYDLLDYVHIKGIKPVPKEHGYVTVSRARQIKNLDRIAERQVRRDKTQKLTFEKAKANIIKRYAEEHNISEAESIEAYNNPKLNSYPYIRTRSLSGKKSYPLELKQVEKTEKVEGKFSTYGLSSNTTLPHWEKEKM